MQFAIHQATAYNARYVLLYCNRIHYKSMQYGNKIQKSFGKDKSCQEHRHFLCVDGTVFSQSVWGSEQEEPFGIQGVFGRELQAADCEPEIARYQ